VLKGFHLTLLVGPMVPRAASYEVVEALTNVEVRIETAKASTFQLQFQVGKRSKLDDTFMLNGSTQIPIIRVVLIVTIQGQPNVLIDGVMTNHQYTPATRGNSFLTVTGEDLTKLMDQQDQSGMPFPAMPGFVRVGLLLSKYGPLGIIPKVIPNISSFAHSPLTKIPCQQGTDLAYIRYLASIAGYEFYLEPLSSPGKCVAYWGPSIKFGQPQASLTTNSDAHSNVESLNLSHDPHELVTPVLTIQDPITKLSIPIPIGDISSLNPSLGKNLPKATQFAIANNAAKLSFAEALEQGMAMASKSANLVHGTGTLDVSRYGRVLQARKLVGVRGAGEAFDGVYYVEQVTHKIQRGEYKQEFSLSRNALGALTSKVPA
jgi:hypothetical protein